MLPESLLGSFTAQEAVALGIGVKTLARLKKAGLAVADAGVWQLVEPVRPSLVALAAVGPPAALCSVTAADHFGWQLLERPDRVHVAVPLPRRPLAWPNLIVHRYALRTDDLVTVGGVRLTSPARTALDVAATVSLPESLALLDFLLRAEILDAEQLSDGIARMGKRPGSLRAARAVRLASGRRASAAESLFRALVHQGRLPAPMEQFAIRVSDRRYRADFAWPERRLLVEIDGFAYHSDKQAFVRDRRRQNDLVAAGWKVLRFAASDLSARPAEVIAELRMALLQSRR